MELVLCPIIPNDLGILTTNLILGLVSERGEPPFMFSMWSPGHGFSLGPERGTSQFM